jgi:4-hydroxybenzoate polyprenyltransferase
MRITLFLAGAACLVGTVILYGSPWPPFLAVFAFFCGVALYIHEATKDRIDC